MILGVNVGILGSDRKQPVRHTYLKGQRYRDFCPQGHWNDDDRYDPILEKSHHLKPNHHLPRLFIPREQILVNAAAAQEHFNVQLKAKVAQQHLDKKKHLPGIKKYNNLSYK